jgi:hypothetical protein
MNEAALGRFGDQRRAAVGAPLLSAIQAKRTLGVHRLAEDRNQAPRFNHFLANPAVSNHEMLVTAGRHANRRAAGRLVLAIMDPKTCCSPRSRPTSVVLGSVATVSIPSGSAPPSFPYRYGDPRQLPSKPATNWTIETAHAITSRTVEQAGPAQLLALSRTHQGNGNKLQYVSDVTCREGQARAHAGHAPQVLAAFRNTAPTIIRRPGYKVVEGSITARNTA